MRLLIDEMWPPAVAVQLRRRWHDVVAVAERPELKGMPDPALFAVAQAEGRAVVTENVPDFRPLAAAALAQGQAHAGLVLTGNARYPRHDPRTSGRLVTALEALLASGAELANQERWLS